MCYSDKTYLLTPNWFYAIYHLIVMHGYICLVENGKGKLISFSFPHTAMFCSLPIKCSSTERWGLGNVVNFHFSDKKVFFFFPFLKSLVWKWRNAKCIVWQAGPGTHPHCSEQGLVSQGALQTWVGGRVTVFPPGTACGQFPLHSCSFFKPARCMWVLQDRTSPADFLAKESPFLPVLYSVAFRVWRPGEGFL